MAACSATNESTGGTTAGPELAEVEAAATRLAPTPITDSAPNTATASRRDERTRRRMARIDPRGPRAGRPGSRAMRRRVRSSRRLAVAVFGALSVMGVGASLVAAASTSASSGPAVVPPVDSFVAGARGHRW